MPALKDKLSVKTRIRKQQKKAASIPLAVQHLSTYDESIRKWRDRLKSLTEQLLSCDDPSGHDEDDCA